VLLPLSSPAITKSFCSASITLKFEIIVAFFFSSFSLISLLFMLMLLLAILSFLFADENDFFLNPNDILVPGKERK
jgi:hypothetical protein